MFLSHKQAPFKIKGVQAKSPCQLATCRLWNFHTDLIKAEEKQLTHGNNDVNLRSAVL
jgi:hypothetical protein